MKKPRQPKYHADLGRCLDLPSKYFDKYHVDFAKHLDLLPDDVEYLLITQRETSDDVFISTSVDTDLLVDALRSIANVIEARSK